MMNSVQLESGRQALVEREGELLALGSMLDAVGDGGARVCAVSGPPGIGKTALLRAVTREAATRQGWTVLAATCTQVGAQVSHGVLAQWFTGLARETAPGEAPFDGHGAVLHKLLLGESVATDVASLSYAVQWVVAWLTRQGKLLLVVDDLQWADETSAAVLANAVGLLSPEPVALLFGIRDGATASRSEVVRAVFSSADVVIEPHTLSRDAVATLVGDRSIDAARLHELSGGVPFYVAELAAHAAIAGTLGSSTRVIEAVSQRLDRLGPESLAVARAVAVLADDAFANSVGALAGVGAAALPAIVDALIAEGILDGYSSGNAAPSPLRIAHPLVAEAILVRLGPLGLDELHREAARLLAVRGAADHVVAAHLLRSTPSADPWRAHTLERAARFLLVSGAASTAAACLEHALLEGGSDGAERARLLGLAGAANLRALRTARAIELWQESTELIADAVSLARRKADIGDAFYTLSDYDAAGQVYTEAMAGLRAAGVPDDGPAMRELAARAAAASLCFAPSTAVLDGEVMRAVLARDPESDSIEDRMMLSAAALAMCVLGHEPTIAAATARRAYAGGAIVRPGFSSDPTAYLLSGALNVTGQHDLGIELLDAAIRDARARGSVLDEATAAYCRGGARLIGGDVRSATSDLLVAANARQLGWSAYREAAEAFLIRCHLISGDLSAATLVVGEDADGGAGPLMQAAQLVGRAEYALATGSAHKALDIAQRAAVILPIGGERLLLGWRAVAGEALRKLGDLPAARRLALDELELLEGSGPVGMIVPARVRLARATADPGEAVGILRTALDLLDDRERWQRAELCEVLGALLVDLGRPDEAHPFLADALRCARAQGLAPLEASARRLLQRIGRPAIPTAIELRVASLSTAERRIADLVATGLSNRQVAREAFVTIKTVEFHLSRCYRKLEVATRGELAGVLASVAPEAEAGWSLQTATPPLSRATGLAERPV